MGCDIHAYLEYKYSNDERDKYAMWWQFAEVHIGRDYQLFALMARVCLTNTWEQVEKVRLLFEKYGVSGTSAENVFTSLEEIGEELQVELDALKEEPTQLHGIDTFEPKGIPSGLCSRTGYEYHLWVRDDDDEHERGSCSLSNAESWVESGSSEWVNDEKTSVTNPDWHTPSWLSTEEVATVIDRYKAVNEALVPGARKEFDEMVQRAKARNSDHIPDWKDWDPTRAKPTEMLAILGAMKALEENGLTARLVFWFDN